MAGQFSYPLEQAQIEAFERDGAIHLPALIDEEWVERGREAGAGDTGVESLDGSGAPEYFLRLRLWEKGEVLRHFCTASPAPGIAAQLVGSDKMNLLYDQLFSIEPGSEDRTIWHHDLPYWPIRGRQVVTIWLALDRIVKENGGLEFIRGSHLWGQRFQPMSTTDGQTYEPFDSGRDDGFVPAPDFDAERDKYEFISFDVDPGDAIAFHALTVHGSHLNATADMKRRAYSMRFTGDDVRYYAGPVWNVYIRNPSLKTGDLMDSEQYPVVFDARSSQP